MVEDESAGAAIVGDAFLLRQSLLNLFENAADFAPEQSEIEVRIARSAAMLRIDVADRGGLTLEEVGALTNLTRERIRQVEVSGLLAAGASSLKEAA